mgnify:CR=1 FL=1
MGFGARPWQQRIHASDKQSWPYAMLSWVLLLPLAANMSHHAHRRRTG